MGFGVLGVGSFGFGVLGFRDFGVWGLGFGIKVWGLVGIRVQGMSCNSA